MNKFEIELSKLKNNIKCFYNLIPEYVDGKFKDKKEVLIPLEKHIAVCERCKKEIEDYKNYTDDYKTNNELYEKFKKKIEKIEIPDKPSGLEEGQVWGMPAFPLYITYKLNLNNEVLPYSLEPRPLLIYKIEDEEIFGYPINFDNLRYASEFDLIVEKNETELNTEFMIEVWNPQRTSKEFIGKNFWGRLPEEILKKVEILSLDFNGFEVSEESEIVTGSPIELENDLRNEFQEIEKEATEVISAPYIERMEYMDYIEGLRNDVFNITNIILVNEYIKDRNKSLMSLAASSGRKDFSNAIISKKGLAEIFVDGKLELDENYSENFIAVEPVFSVINPEQRITQTIQWDIPKNIGSLDGGEHVFIFDVMDNELIGAGTVVVDGDDKIVSVSEIFFDNVKRVIKDVNEIQIIIIGN